MRLIVVEALADARRQEGEGLDQPADMRILDRILGEPEAAGDAGVLGGELRRGAAYVQEFAVVVGEDVVRHYFTAPTFSSISCGHWKPRRRSPLMIVRVDGAANFSFTHRLPMAKRRVASPGSFLPESASRPASLQNVGGADSR